MKVSDLAKVQELDQKIQQLLLELSDLYATRDGLVADTPASRRPRRRLVKTQQSALDEIDFSTFDLSLK